MENALIDSLGDVYDQVQSPGDQLQMLVKMLQPIAHKCIGMGPGNHSRRTMKKVNLDPDMLLAQLLGIPDKYLGITLAGVIKIGPRTIWRIVAHHTTGGGRSDSGKLAALLRLAETWPCENLYIGAHTHAGISDEQKRKAISVNKGTVGVRWYQRFFTGSGAALDYDGSYAEVAMMPPAVDLQVKLTLHRDTHNGGGVYTKHLDRKVIYL